MVCVKIREQALCLSPQLSALFETQSLPFVQAKLAGPQASRDPITSSSHFL